MRLKIVSDGSISGTKVTDENGNFVENVQAIRFRAHVNDLATKATIELRDVAVELHGETKVRGGAEKCA
jgi:hypothetical protein